MPTKNSAFVLKKCLDSIKIQTYANLETIIVDDFSNDNTKDIVKSYSAKFIQTACNKPEARNIGIQNSNGEYLLLLDSDMVLDKTVVQEIVEKFQNEKCDAVYIPEGYQQKGFWEKCRDIEKGLYAGLEFVEAPRAYRKEILGKVLFDEFNEGPDEHDFYLNAKSRIQNSSRTKAQISVLETPFNFKKKFNHGKFFTYYKNKHKEFAKKQSSLNRLKILIKAVKISPPQAAGIFLLKIIEYTFFSLGRINGYFDRRILRKVWTAEKEFNSIGKNYEKKMYTNSKGNEFINEYEKKKVIDLVQKSTSKTKDIRALDIGAGNGRWSREFQKMGMNVTALDVSEEMCKILSENKSLKVINGDIEKAALTARSFDFIFSFRAFKYVNNRKKALANIHKTLKDEGTFLVEMPNANNLLYFFPNLFAPIVFQLTKRKKFKNFILADLVSKASFEKELKGSGFTLVKTNKMLFFPHKAYSMIRNETLLKIVQKIDSAFENISPRSYVFMVKK
ncbi:MAG TPA: glycosyltransferase [archaeon]|nr:glycosyltransferase [archaeon]